MKHKGHAGRSAWEGAFVDVGLCVFFPYVGELCSVRNRS